MLTNNAQTQDQAVKFGLMDIVNMILFRWKIGLAVGVVFAAAFCYVILGQEDVYEASTSLTVELRSENVTNFREIVDTNLDQHNLLQTVINTHIERIKTRRIAEIVVELMTDAEVEAIIAPYTEDAFVREDPENSADAAGIMLSHCLEVKPGGEDESQVIRITATHPDPASAQLIANTYANAFIAYKVGARSDSTDRAAVFLQRQIEAMREQVKVAEEELQVFRQEHNLVTVEQSQGIIVERMKRINDALTAAKIREFEAKARMKQVIEAGDDTEKLMQISFIGGNVDVSDIYNQLSELRRERKVLDDTYLARHPKILENTASQASVREALSMVLAQRKQHVASEFEAIASEITELEQSLAQSEQDVLATERALVEYRMVENDLQNKREIFSQLLTRYNETLVSREIESSSFTILDPATKPRFPNSISKVQIGAAALVLAGFFFIFIPLALEILDTRLKSFSDIEVFTQKPVIGDLAFFSDTKFESLAKAVSDKQSELRENFRAIFGAIRMRCDLGKSDKSFLITSTLPGEGKSTVASNLALSFANHGYSVLLIDLDLRRPVQHEVFGLKNEQGLLHWLNGGANVEANQPLAEHSDLGIQSVADGLSLLPAGGIADSPTESLGNVKLEQLLQRCREEYDLVIMDTPPVGLFLDATIVAEHADQSIFVTQQFKAKKTKVGYAINLMERSRAPIMGVIFNGIKKPKIAMGYGNHADLGHYGAGYEQDRSQYSGHYGKPASS
jgi:capsular exopolysaccharide synthesis family protein